MSSPILFNPCFLFLPPSLFISVSNFSSLILLISILSFLFFSTLSQYFDVSRIYPAFILFFSSSFFPLLLVLSQSFLFSSFSKFHFIDNCTDRSQRRWHQALPTEFFKNIFPSNSHAHYTSVSYLQQSLRQFSLLYHFPVTLSCLFFPVCTD